jgi:cytochrome c biogenesis protein CcmG/thiol:disulfide interchange protein DsbE
MGTGGGLPSVTLPCLGNGPAVNVAGLSGTPAVVSVWASWCTSCGAELGYLATVSDQLGKRVQFLGVDTEDQSDSALSELPATRPPVRFPSVVDEDKHVMLGLHAAGPPETALVNSAGRVVHVHRGAYASAAAVRADIATYLHVSA